MAEVVGWRRRWWGREAVVVDMDAVVEVVVLEMKAVVELAVAAVARRGPW